ncbi:hypothetical protein QJ856_gp0678 [Tupanvirus deep ocean]|uniref:Uncharacterized protein n=2 Tax=Tupanvirus TaxID=2094720 RepID=A0AC62A8X9_9VIRU|nr:hypothetical protein QJ856_gp0678 [Tupanvirus deep ocean]QKU34073.1 hypothetical protein [Tupanvirus deep ocean]
MACSVHSKFDVSSTPNASKANISLEQKLLKPLSLSQYEFVVKIIKELLVDPLKDKKTYRKIVDSLGRKYRFMPSTNQLRYVYSELLTKNEIKQHILFEEYAKVRQVRENSGVLVFTVLTSPYPETGEFESNFTPVPDIESYKYDSGAQLDIRKINPQTGERRQDFTCPFNCHYCPNVPGYARSYLPLEPAVARGDQNNWDACLQIRDRARTYIANGITKIDKAEVIVEGGTYTSYPHHYRIKFMRDIFYAFNTLSTLEDRERLTLAEEIKINETAGVKVVGLSIETRPDCITKPLIREFRKCGITRIQLGIQHTDDSILKLVNRQCTTRKAKNAIRMLKDSCFKIQIHLMPDLPGSNPDIDRKMFDTILYDDDLQVDSLKVYPCQVLDYTMIKQWYDEGSYKPYAETLVNGVSPLIDVIADFKSKVHPWIRNERIIRDIPAKDIMGGVKTTNLRQLAQDYMKSKGVTCKCIRCREVRNVKVDNSNMKLIVRNYKSSGGTEYFISFESLDESTIYGFCRLRLTPNSSTVVSELDDCAMIRELHVYGKMNAVGCGKQELSSQHLGLGKRLLNKAEQIALEAGYKKIAVISGVGVRNYYRKLGYTDSKYYLIKSIENKIQNKNIFGIENIFIPLLFILFLMSFVVASIYY